MTLQSTHNHGHAHGASSAPCAEVPDFERLNYFYGQMLSAADFRSEQAYFREKMKLHNRCLHGYGVVCGLEVIALPSSDCCKSATGTTSAANREKLAQIEAGIAALKGKLAAEGLADDERKSILEEIDKLSAAREALLREAESQPATQLDGSRDCVDGKPQVSVAVQCGLALDCHGNEIVLRQTVHIDLWSLLDASAQRRLREAGKGLIYLGICHCGEPINPTRPVVPDSCGTLADCNFGKTRESVRFSATIDRPPDDERCETCCTGCGCECQLLAAIGWHAGEPIRQEAIDNAVRRAIGLYEPTRITGISWAQGASYTPQEAKGVLGTETAAGRTDGLEITFSRPVHAETLAPGVIDLWRVQGGRGIGGLVSLIEGEYVGKPDTGLISSVRYRDASRETLNEGDRVLIVVRGDFILDHCCRPIDGNHIGGRVPQLPGYRSDGPAEPVKTAAAEADAVQPPSPPPAQNPDCRPGKGGPCHLPPGGIGPWTSGNGQPGGSFESWFFIKYS